MTDTPLPSDEITALREAMASLSERLDRIEAQGRATFGAGQRTGPADGGLGGLAGRRSGARG